MGYVVPRSKPPRGVLLSVALFLVVFAFILLLGGFVAPGWTFAEVEIASVSIETHTGLWYAVVCIVDNCESGSIVTSDDTDGFLKYRIMTTISLVFAIVALIVAAIIRKPSSRGLKWFGGIACFVSGGLAIVSASIHGDDMREADELLGDVGFDSPYKFPYALFLFGLGGVLILIAAILIMVSACQRQPSQAMVYEKRMDYVEERPVAQPYAAQPYPVKYQEPQQYRSSQYEPQVIRTSQMAPQQQVVYTHAPVHYAYPQSTRHSELGYDPRSSRSYRSSNRADHVVSIGRL